MAATPVIDDLVASHLPLAAHLARRYAGRGVELDDLEQVANLALVKAARGYDDEQGSFAPFASATIRGELKKYFRDYAWSVRPPRRLQELQAAVTAATAAHPGDVDIDAVAQELGVEPADVREALAVNGCFSADSLDRPLQLGGATVGETLEVRDRDLDLADERVTFSGLCHDLADDERSLLRMRFVEECTQQQIADRLGISQMQVSRRLRTLLDGLRGQALEAA